MLALGAVPFGHAEHEPCPASGFRCPGGHVVHVDEPASANLPLVQLVQVDNDVAAVAVDAVPLGHSVHEAWPAELANRPGTHVEQLKEPSVLNVPGPQLEHAVRDVDPVAAFLVPPGQARQLESPALLPYRPGGQEAQAGWPIGAKDPMPHTAHALMFDDPKLGFAVPLGHREQAERPGVPPYRPGSQLEQLDEPAAA